MSLTSYFQKLIEKVEASDIGNLGKDKDGFFKPTRTVLIRQLNLLKDLHDKPRAKPMVLDAWREVVKELPAEWLIMTDEQKKEMAQILK